MHSDIITNPAHVDKTTTQTAQTNVQRTNQSNRPNLRLNMPLPNIPFSSNPLYRTPHSPSKAVFFKKQGSLNVVNQPGGHLSPNGRSLLSPTLAFGRRPGDSSPPILPPRPSSSHSSRSHHRSTHNEEPRVGWACSECTYINNALLNVCEICNHLRSNNAGNAQSPIGTIYSKTVAHSKRLLKRHKHSRKRDADESDGHNQPSP